MQTQFSGEALFSFNTAAGGIPSGKASSGVLTGAALSPAGGLEVRGAECGRPSARKALLAGQGRDGMRDSLQWVPGTTHFRRSPALGGQSCLLLGL